MSCVDLPWQQERSRLAGDSDGASRGSSDQWSAREAGVRGDWLVIARCDLKFGG